MSAKANIQNKVNDVIFSPHNPNNQLINTGNNASDFLESGCFRRKIMTQSNRFELTSSF